MGTLEGRKEQPAIGLTSVAKKSPTETLLEGAGWSKRLVSSKSTLLSSLPVEVESTFCTQKIRDGGAPEAGAALLINVDNGKLRCGRMCAMKHAIAQIQLNRTDPGSLSEKSCSNIVARLSVPIYW